MDKPNLNQNDDMLKRIDRDFLYTVQALSRNYSRNKNNMYTCLIETVKEIQNNPLRELILQLVSDFQRSRYESETRIIVEYFSFRCGTYWAKRLGQIILKDFLESEDVANELCFLVKEMEYAHGNTERESYSLNPVEEGNEQ